MERFSRNTHGPSNGVPSLVSTTDRRSRAITGMHKISIGSASKSRMSTVDEEGFMTVEPAKPPASTTKIKSMQIGGGTSPAIPNPGFSQAGSVAHGNDRKISWAPEARPARNSIFTQVQKPGNRLSVSSTAAASRPSAYTSNWRGPRVPVGDELEGHTWKGSADRSVRPSANSTKYPKAFYKPGMMIRAALHEQDFRGANSTITVEKGITPSEYGNIHTKYRKMIVVACYTNHYTAVPLYTHGGRGLDNKDSNEYISVRDYRDKSSNFKRLSKHGVLNTEQLHNWVNLYDPKSTAHITYPVSRSYDLPVIHEGQLGSDSVEHLHDLVEMYAPKALKALKR